MKKIILTGGAGYLASCTAKVLMRAGYEPIGIDDYSTSSRRELPYRCLEADLSDLAATRKVFREIGKTRAVFHFAAKALVPESVKLPETYFRNNLLSALNAAELAVETGTPCFVHSSSCATYGIPETLPITEDMRGEPLSPYGESKLLVERMLTSIAACRPLRVLNLRYFNPAGAIEQGGWEGECHEPETHLIPNVVKALLAKSSFEIFGTDYPTPDGTCQRDFIHVEDLALAHLSGLEFLESSSTKVERVNLGGGRGVSVREIVEAAERVLKGKIVVKESARRKGDAPILFADITKARTLLKWEPKRTLDEMILSHFKYLQSRLES